MGLISIEGMKFHAYHGVYAEEQIVGNDFIIDVFIQTDIDTAGESDDLSDTINYETIYLICKAEMSKPTQLIETLLGRLIFAMKYQFNSIHQIRVKIRKLNPIPGGEVAWSSVETEESFADQCPRCGKGMICYGDATCWCQDLKVHPHTLENIQKQYKSCLCKSCLAHYSG